MATKVNPDSVNRFLQLQSGGQVVIKRQNVIINRNRRALTAVDRNQCQRQD